MKAHLIKSDEVDPELFTRVIDLLQSVPGINSFSCDEKAIINFSEDETYIKTIPAREEFEQMEEALPMRIQHSIMSGLRSFPLKNKTADWQELFAKTSSYRTSKQISEKEFVMLLTDIANQHNWFASLDPAMPFNGFIHTADWNYYLDVDLAFPIAYEVIALMLQRNIFGGYIDLKDKVHDSAIGCVSDLCMNKKDIILKLRTADVCPVCMEKLREQLTLPEIHHALQIMESLRTKMLYAQNFKQYSPPSRLVIDKRKRFFLPDYGNIEIKLYPLEKALYLLFLAHPEGIYLSSLSEHREELYEIYSQLSSRGMAEEMKERIAEITNALRDSAAQKISKIKKVFTDSIGQELADHYIIQGENAERKRIKLERGLVLLQDS